MKTKISSFLKERPERFKPNEANRLGLKRLGKIDFLGNIHIVKKPTKTNMILVKPGDLVISGINVEKGAVAVYIGDRDILATIHYSSYEFDKNKINIDYFKWFLKTDTFRKLVKEQTKGGIKTEIKPKHFLPIEIDLPPIETQKKILEKINSVKDEIKQIEQNVSQDELLLKKLRQAILSEAVQGKLVTQNPSDEPASELLKKINLEKNKLIKEGKLKKQKPLPEISEDEIPYELPKGWVWTRLGEVCERIHYGYTASAINDSEGIKLLRITDIQNDRVNWNNVPSCRIKNEEIPNYILKKNDILIARTGGTIGKSYLVNGTEEFRSVFASYLIRAIPLKNILSGYVKLFLGSSLYWTQLAEGTTGTGQPNVNGVTLSKLKFPLPPLAEQKRIVERVDVLMKYCDELEEIVKENKENSKNLLDVILEESFNSKH